MFRQGRGRRTVLSLVSRYISDNLGRKIRSVWGRVSESGFFILLRPPPDHSSSAVRSVYGLSFFVFGVISTVS